MNEQAIIDSYNLAVQNGYKKSIDEFKVLLSTNQKALNDVYGLAVQNGYSKSIDDYKVLMGVSKPVAAVQQEAVVQQPKKKEDTTALPSGVGSSVSPASADPEALRFAELAKKQGEITPRRTDEPGYIDPRKKLSMYPTKEEADQAINQALSDISVTTGKVPELGEYDDVDYFTGGFGNALRTFDKVSQTGLGELVDDIGRSFAQGYAQGDLAQASNKVIRAGNQFTEEDVQSLIDKSEVLNSLPPSQEFEKYLKTYEEEGKTVWGAVKGLMENPTVLGEVAVSSLVGMATNREAVLAGLGTLAAAFGTGAATGGTAGSFVIPGVGTFVGAAAAGLSAAASALPFAFGAASTVVETGAVFAQGLQEQLGTDENGNPVKPTKENVRAILEDPEKYNKIKNDAILRGFTVGIIDAVGGKLATNVGARILKSSARATGNITKAGLVKSLGAGGVIEGAAGGTGEALGQVVIDKPIDTGNVVLEIAAEMPGALRTTLMAGLKVPTYKINGDKVSAEEIDTRIATMTPEQLAAADIVIANDFEGREKKLQDKIVTGSIVAEVRAAQPNLNEPTVNAIVDLQKELNKLEGNKTQVAKDRAAQIRADIKNLQENQLPEAVTETKVKESGLTPEQRRQQIESIELDLKFDDRMLQEGGQSYNTDERRLLEEQLQTLKEEEDAFQKQAAGQVPVQPTAGGRQEVAQGEPQAEPQGITKENIKEKIAENNNKAEELRNRQKAELEELNKRENKNYADAFDILNVNEYSQDQSPRSQDAIDLANRHEKEFNDLLQEKRNIESEAEKLTFSDYNLTDTNKLDRLRESINSVYQSNRNALDEGFEVSVNALDEANSVGASDYVAHGMGKTSLANAYNDLINLFNKGINPVRGRGSLDVAPLSGGVSTGTTASGNAYMDGPFTLVANRNHSGPITNINQIGGIIVNEGLATPEVLTSLRDLFPNLVIESTSNTRNLVEQLNSKPQAEPQGVTEAGVQEEVAPQVELTDDQIVEYNPTEEISDKNIEVLLKVFKSKKFEPTAEPIVTDLGDSVVFEYNNFDDTDENARAWFIFKKKKDGSITANGLKVERNRGNFRNTQFFKNYIESKRAELAAQPEVTPTIPPAPVVEEVSPEPILVDGQEGPILITEKEVKSRLPKFTKDNATDYETDYKEDSMGRDVEYISSLTVEAEDIDGVSIGTITRLTDEDKINTYKVEDSDGIEIGRGKEYDTEAEAIKALTDHVNKKRKKEFDKEVAKILKQREKAAAKASAKEAKKKAVQTEDILAEEEIEGLLESTLDFLDSLDNDISITLRTRANDALLGIPLTVAQGIVKGLKVLVKGGMKLRDAIKQIAAENNISQDKLKELLDVVSISEEFNAIMARADELIARQKGKNIDDKKILSNVEAKLRKEPAYIDGTDAQRKIMEREVRAKMGAEPRKAASIGRVIGALKDITNVTREEKLKIIGRIRELGRDVAKDLAAEIRSMASQGTITAKQAADVVARFGKVNMLNEISVSNFVDYMAKVFANAEYVSQLDTAKSTRKKLRSLSKDKNKSANLRDLAAKFVEIDPTMVEDITAYNEVAKKIKESVEGSSIRGKDVKFADIVKEGTVVPYIDETLKAQNEKLYQERLKEVKDIFGIDAKDLSYDELLVLLSEGKEKEKQEIRFSFENLDTNELMNSIINAFDVYSSILESAIRTGVDPFTGEQVTYTESQKKLISEFIKMDLNILSPKQALEAVDSLLNFVQNNSTAKMESILKAYQGEANIRGLVEDKVKASPLRKYWSKPLGQTIGEQLTNLDLLIEKMFKGFRRGLEIANAIGLNDIKNGKASAMSESNKIVNEYVAEFFEKKANGEAFNTDFNDVERGMAAFMMRNVVGTEAQMKAEFNRRKQLVKESIDELAQGDEREVGYSEVYQEVYDKILKDAKTIEDVTSKVDKVNLDAIKFWQSKWSEKYEELSDVSLNVYNKVLEKDINYTPDRLSKLSTDNEPVEISTDDMVFHSNNGTIYKKETGVLMQATRPKSLPKNSNTGLPSRYVSLSFDKNNSNAMYDALVDIKTAGPVRQAEAFINSKYFRKLVPQSEDATILQNRIKLYVNNIRNKNPYSNDAASKLIRGLNSIASIGVGQALGGLFQPIKQMIPIGVNTLVNAKGLDVASMFDKAKQEFLNNSGYGIANRGVESQAQIESLNKLIKKASESKGDKAIKLLEEANRLQLKMFLVKPDAYIARASWMTYYEQELKRLGIDPKTIDYTTHKINKKAADYAEAMVNRQQNVSDADLAGNLLAGRSDGKQMFVKLLMPFASFRMNQSARIGADIGTFLSKTATKEDKAIAARSLSGFAAEMVTFRAISIGTGLVISAITSALMGTDEEEDKKKKDSIIKGQLTSVVADIFSPIPYTDKFIQSGVAGALDIVQDAMDIDEENRLTLFSGKNQELLESLGLFGISAARAAQLVELIMLSTTGEYKDSFGKKKYISDDRKEALQLLIGPAILANIGLLPVEVNSVVRSSIAASKKKSSTKEGGPAPTDYESESIKRMEKDLLEGYENKTEMKRYDPELYEQNFGEGSEYYEMTKEKREEKKLLEQEKQAERDAEYGYTEKKKGGFGSKRFGSSKRKSKWD